MQNLLYFVCLIGSIFRLETFVLHSEEHGKITSTIELLSVEMSSELEAGFKVLEGRGDEVQSATHPGARPSSSAVAVGCSSPSERRGHSRAGPSVHETRDSQTSIKTSNFEANNFEH